MRGVLPLVTVDEPYYLPLEELELHGLDSCISCSIEQYLTRESSMDPTTNIARISAQVVD